MLERERERVQIDQNNTYLQYRTIIVDWMCEVAEEFKLNPYAVQLSVHYFDLTLQRLKVKKSKLQLVAMCCTLLAGASARPRPRAACRGKSLLALTQRFLQQNSTGRRSESRLSRT